MPWKKIVENLCVEKFVENFGNKERSTVLHNANTFPRYLFDAFDEFRSGYAAKKRNNSALMDQNFLEP